MPFFSLNIGAHSEHCTSLFIRRTDAF